MANTYILGGSPLGLINVRSRTDKVGQSTFNGGSSRNISVFAYNKSEPQPAGVIIGGKEVFAPRSLNTGDSLPNFFPNVDIGKIGAEPGDDVGLEQAELAPGSKKGRGVNSNLHNDAIYDVSLLNILEKLSKSPSVALRPQDFAYCKYLGVYPNNRLMIARRFSGAVKDNIYTKGGSKPKSVLLSWKPENEDFLEFTFGEEWVEADADFTNLLNRLGKDFGIEGGGTGLSKALNVIPLPSFTEGLQRDVLKKLGVLNSGSGEPLPSGNPNMIKQAKRRKTIAAGEAGSGLKASFSIKMTCEYEQKFISGIDPTTAWQDILNNILIFGTSNSSNYGLSSGFVAKLNKWASNPGSLVKDIIEAVKSAINNIISTIEQAAKDALKLLNDAVGPQEEVPAADQLANNQKMVDKAKAKIKGFFDKIIKSAYATISKYKVEIMGIANALSGNPSTPWHLTLGNPLKPFFCSGDMYISSDVKVNLGPTLAFNDLPSSIKVEFTLQNARPLGMQEILAKFNTGHLRTVNIKKDYLDVDYNIAPGTSDADAQAILDKPFQNDYFDVTFDQTGTKLLKTNDSQNQGTTPGSPSVPPTDSTTTNSTSGSSGTSGTSGSAGSSGTQGTGNTEGLLSSSTTGSSGSSGTSGSSTKEDGPIGSGGTPLDASGVIDANLKQVNLNS